MKQLRVVTPQLALLVAIFATVQLSHAQTITTFDVPNSNFTEPTAINPSGAITGSYGDLVGRHGFVRKKDGTLTTFDAPPPYQPGVGQQVWTGPTSINAAGEITGFVYPVTDQYWGFIRRRNGTIVEFNESPCFQSTSMNALRFVFIPPVLPLWLYAVEGIVPTAINDRGQVAGICAFAAPVPEGFSREPDGTVTTFFVPTTGVGNPWTRALAINSRGQIAGMYCCTPNFGYQGYVREPDGTLNIFDVPGSSFQIPVVSAINAKGQITGFADTGFLRQPDGTIVPFVVPNATSTQPTSINARGAITGAYVDVNSTYHAFVRDKHGSLTTFDVPNATNTFATGINARGEVTGWYSDVSGTHGFIVE
jgi:hypothetical protein